MSENGNEKMPTRGIRMPDELWNTCVEMSEELGYGYPSDFIRDAIEFFTFNLGRRVFLFVIIDLYVDIKIKSNV